MPEKVCLVTGVGEGTGAALRCQRLGDRAFVGSDYSIADMDIFPWIHRLTPKYQTLDEFPNIARWHRGLLIRPLGNVVYLMPPYCIGDDELSRAYDVIAEALRSI
jgi:hypothetical protein